MTYKDVIREHALRKINKSQSASDSEDSGSDSEASERKEKLFKKKGKETLAEEEARLKADF